MFHLEFKESRNTLFFSLIDKTSSMFTLLYYSYFMHIKTSKSTSTLITSFWLYIGFFSEGSELRFPIKISQNAKLYYKKFNHAHDKISGNWKLILCYCWIAKKTFFLFHVEIDTTLAFSIPCSHNLCGQFSKLIIFIMQ
jgi:hypothetical protein